METPLKLSQNREWLLRMAEEEAGCDIYICNFTKRPPQSLAFLAPNIGLDVDEPALPEAPPEALEPAQVSSR